MAILDPVKLGAFIDDPSADDANIAFARINANEKLLNEEVRPIATGGTGATTLEQAQVNLGIDQVDNTPDSEKPISTAAQLALNDKVNKADVIDIAKGGTGGETLQEAQDNLGITLKVEQGNSFHDAFGGQVDYYLDNAAPEQTPNTFTSCADFPVGSRILVSSNKGYPDLPNLDGYTYMETKATYNSPGRLQIAHGCLNGRMAVRASGSGYEPYSEWNYLYGTTDIIPVSNGGTGGSTAAEARTNLGAAGLGYNNFFGTQVVRDIAAVGRYEYGEYGVIQWIDESYFYLLLTNKNDRTGTFNDKRPFILNLESGGIGIDSLNLNTPLSLSSGGTGATNSTDARSNLGAFYNGGFQGEAWASDVGWNWASGVYRGNIVGGSDAVVHFNAAGSSSGAIQLRCSYQNNGLMFRSARDGMGFERAWDSIYSTYNVAVDGNGFLKRASPVVDLYADRIVANAQAQKQNVTFEKLGIGDYLIKGSLGFAQENWYVEQPKDANGNVFHAVIYDTLENGDISIKTYERKLEGVNIVADLTKPVDIKENRFISIRLHEEPEVPSSPEINPELLDNEGKAAPSEYHTLEDGVWTITANYAAVLEQRRLENMKPLKRRQFRLTLVMNGYDLKQVEALIDGIEDPMQRTIALIEWQDATDFERTNPTLLKMVELMQLTTEQVDALWAYGLSL